MIADALVAIGVLVALAGLAMIHIPTAIAATGALLILVGVLLDARSRPRR